MKTYRGYNEGGTAATAHLVTVTDWPNSPEERVLEHHVLHSPTGFSWGYGGSGPADLARSILWDHLGAAPHPACYQAFKFAFVANWPQDSHFVVTDTQIAAWLATYDGRKLDGEWEEI